MTLAPSVIGSSSLWLGILIAIALLTLATRLRREQLPLSRKDSVRR
jgi:hypothetical protein